MSAPSSLASRPFSIFLVFHAHLYHGVLPQFKLRHRAEAFGRNAPEIGGERGRGGITREEVIAELSVSAVREERFGAVGIHVYGIVHAVLHGCRQTDFAVVESPPSPYCWHKCLRPRQNACSAAWHIRRPLAGKSRRRGAHLCRSPPSAIGRAEH